MSFKIKKTMQKNDANQQSYPFIRLSTSTLCKKDIKTKIFCPNFKLFHKATRVSKHLFHSILIWKSFQSNVKKFNQSSMFPIV